MAVRAMRKMFETIRELQADRQDGNPFLQILGVVPTMYNRQWREHQDYKPIADLLERSLERHHGAASANA